MSLRRRRARKTCLPLVRLPLLQVPRLRSDDSIVQASSLIVIPAHLTRITRSFGAYPHYLASSERGPTVELDSTTLLPIEPRAELSVHAPFASTSNYPSPLQSNAPLNPCTLYVASRAGVYGWNPEAGPARCKFFVFFKHISALAGKIHRNESRFWLDFAGVKVAASTRIFHFDEYAWAPEDVEFNGLGRYREVLMGFVPPQSGSDIIPVMLHVTRSNGTVEHNVPLGDFRYVDNGFS